MLMFYEEGRNYVLGSSVLKKSHMTQIWSRFYNYWSGSVIDTPWKWGVMHMHHHLGYLIEPQKEFYYAFCINSAKNIPLVIPELIFNWYTYINFFMDRHLFIMNSFLHMATLKESKLILFHQQSGALQKQLLFLSFWCVLMVLISSGMLLAPGNSDVSATIAVRKHWWWIYNIQAST